MKYVIQLVLVVVIVVLAYLAYESIARPIRFEEAKNERYSEVIQRLKDIRTAQTAYKDQKGVYADNFDELISFVKNDSLRVPRKIGLCPDTLTDQMAVEIGLAVTNLKPGETPDDILAMGKILRDTVKMPMLDTLFDPGYQIDSIRYIPFSGGEEFKIGAGVVETGSKVKVKVFEAVAKNSQILKGLDKDFFKPSDELRVGSLIEATNGAGNWE
ncbi:MAG: hypothetical protein C0594_16715 [Marinilabiliales bacterium]|nr:MAG: hypothetical protein C0594_16715 [Marinilabiliales bacterium]